MSNINNKHIPEDLDSLTRKDMVELFKIQVEEHKGFIKEIETLRTQLEKANEDYKTLFSAFESCQGELKKANERVRDLEAQLKRLIDYESDQTLLPEASSQGTRQLVNDIKNDATDVGGCYEVSCGLLDSLFEHYTDKGSSKLLNKFAIENQVKGAEALIYSFPLNTSDKMKEWVEQLRKEQASE